MSAVDAFTIEIVARALGELVDNVMFVGGMAGGFLITDPAAPPLRTTDDVDVVVDIAGSYKDELQLLKRLRELGFAEDSREGAPRCRWQLRSIKIDVMFASDDRWFPESLGAPRNWPDHRRLGDQGHTLPLLLANKAGGIWRWTAR